MAGEEFNDLFLSSQVVPESGDLPFFASNITQVEVGTNLGTAGRFFPKGIPRESMLGKFVEKEYGSRFLDKPLVHASRPTLPVVMHEFTHKAINDVKLHTTTREFKNLIKPVTLGGMEMDEEDYIRIIDMRRLPENVDMRDEVKNYFTKLRTKKISEDEFNSLEGNETVLDNLKTLELLVALLPSKTTPVFDSEKNEIELDSSNLKSPIGMSTEPRTPGKPTSPEAIGEMMEILRKLELTPLEKALEEVTGRATVIEGQKPSRTFKQIMESPPITKDKGWVPSPKFLLPTETKQNTIAYLRKFEDVLGNFLDTDISIANVGREKVIRTLADRIVSDFSLEQITYIRTLIGDTEKDFKLDIDFLTEIHGHVHKEKIRDYFASSLARSIIGVDIYGEKI